MSPRYIITGKHIDYHKHVRLEFGAYVQTHEEHNNDMEPRTIGAICLRPSGNEQGGHYFMLLMTEKWLLCHRWTALPMPNNVIEHVNDMGWAQGMPRQIAFADWYGMRITSDGYDSDGSMLEYDEDLLDSDYQPSDDEDDDTTDDSNDDSNGDDDVGHDHDHLDAHLPNAAEKDDDTHSVLDWRANVTESDDEDTVQQENSPNVDAHSSNEESIADTTGVGANDDTDETEIDGESSNMPNTEPTQVDSKPEDIDSDEPVGVDSKQVGVDVDSDEPAGVDSEQVGVGPDPEPDDMAQRMNTRYGCRTHDIGLRPRHECSYTHQYDQQFLSMGEEHGISTHPYQQNQNEGITCLTEQMSFNRGMATFGKQGAESVVVELKQLDY